MEKFEILVAGTGGQGVLLVGSLLEQAAQLSGHRNVIGGEIHGLSQRGGSLSKYVRIGEDVHGPIIPIGGADLMISMELVESVRYLDRLAKDGYIVISKTKMPSAAMWAAGISYPKTEDILDIIRQVTNKAVIFDAEEIARQAGNVLTASVAILGAAVGAVPDLPILPESLKDAIKINFKDRKKLIDLNLRAFEMGMNATARK